MPPAADSSPKQLQMEDAMQFAITAMAVIAGMVFSLAIALLVEELIFGKVFRVFFVRQTVPVKSEHKR
jgi:hypothetical protein